MIFLDPHHRFRIERGARHLGALGARAIAEFLIEDVLDGHDLARLIDRLRQYERCSPELLRAVGADRFPPRLRLVPPE
jgi:hypothetical protein